MWFFIGRFILFWIVWIIFADKKRWREILPVSIFGGFLGSTTDSITEFYKFWEYHGQNGLHSWVLKVLDDWGIYIVVVYLFIQWIPQSRRFGPMFVYWFFWTGGAVSIEWIHMATNHMDHHMGWTLWHSYAVDWVLFWLFYQFHKFFCLELLGIEMEHVGDILFTLDPEGRIMFCHSPWLTEHGFNPKNGVGKTIYEIKGEKKEKGSIHEQSYNRVLSGHSVMFEWTMSIENKTYSFETFLSPIYDKKGKITGMRGVDIVKREFLQEEQFPSQMKTEPI